MGWHNAGDWDDLPYDELIHPVKDVLWAINQRLEYTGQSKIAWEYDGGTKEYPTIADLKSGDGVAIKGDMMHANMTTVRTTLEGMASKWTVSASPNPGLTGVWKRTATGGSGGSALFYGPHTPTAVGFGALIEDAGLATGPGVFDNWYRVNTTLFPRHHQNRFWANCRLILDELTTAFLRPDANCWSAVVDGFYWNPPTQNWPTVTQGLFGASWASPYPYMLYLLSGLPRTRVPTTTIDCSTGAWANVQGTTVNGEIWLYPVGIGGLLRTVSWGEYQTWAAADAGTAKKSSQGLTAGAVSVMTGATDHTGSVPWNEFSTIYVQPTFSDFGQSANGGSYAKGDPMELAFIEVDLSSVLDDQT